MSDTEVQRDTRQRIIDASIHLFGLKGYSGASTREIAKIAKVNIASLNYHFRSKQNLLQEVSAFVLDDFDLRLSNLMKDELVSTAEYAVIVFNSILEDQLRCLNHFKLFLDAENSPRPMDPAPLGFKQFSKFLDHDLKKTVPMEERLWASSVILSYIAHMSVLHSSSLGKKHIEHYLPDKQKTLADYLHRLTSSVIRDLNSRY